jgi:hypothetical protein
MDPPHLDSNTDQAFSPQHLQTTSTTTQASGRQMRCLQGHDAKTLPSHVQKDEVFTKRVHTTGTKCLAMMPTARSPTPLVASASCPPPGESFRPIALFPPPAHGQGRSQLLVTSANPPEEGIRRNLKHHHGAAGSPISPPSVTTMTTPAQPHRRRRTKRRPPPSTSAPAAGADPATIVRRQPPTVAVAATTATGRSRPRPQPPEAVAQAAAAAARGHRRPPHVAAARDRCKPPVADFLAPLLHITGETRPRPRRPPDPVGGCPDPWPPAVAAAGDTSATGEAHRSSSGRARRRDPVEGK